MYGWIMFGGPVSCMAHEALLTTCCHLTLHPSVPAPSSQPSDLPEPLSLPVFTFRPPCCPFCLTPTSSKKTSSRFLFPHRSAAATGNTAASPASGRALTHHFLRRRHSPFAGRQRWVLGPCAYSRSPTPVTPLPPSLFLLPCCLAMHLI